MGSKSAKLKENEAKQVQDKIQDSNGSEIEESPEQISNPILVTPDVLEKHIAKAIINVEKKDYRGTILHQIDQGQIPDALTEFINIHYDDNDSYGYNYDLDVKSTLTPFDAYTNRLGRYLSKLSELEDWQFRKVEDDEGNPVVEEVDLVREYFEDQRRLAMSVYGNQKEYQIRHMKAGFGMPEEYSRDKNATWFGLVKRKKADAAQMGGNE